MPTALIKITQGATTDLVGRAVKGALGTAVVFSNGDDTGVVSWTYELLYVPPGSAIPTSTQGPGGTATFTMTAPDVYGSYRVRLTVADAAGDEDIDIRNFSVPFSGFGFIAPPYQGDPLPLPVSGVGAKPDEMNFAGQPYGWDGNDDAAHPLLYQILEQVDLLASVLSISGTTIDVLGDLALAAGKSADCYTNSGYTKIRRVSQSVAGPGWPTPEVGEILQFHNTDDAKTYLMINDATVGVRKVELT